MASTLTWLDYSERDRCRALDVIDLFRETGTVDELGLAGVGNSYSDLFFPGTTTLQTRACYFLLIPWTFLRLERLRVEPLLRIDLSARPAEDGIDGARGRTVRSALRLKRLAYALVLPNM